jgi:hypothetical protein
MPLNIMHLIAQLNRKLNDFWSDTVLLQECPVAREFLIYCRQLKIKPR